MHFAEFLASQLVYKGQDSPLMEPGDLVDAFQAFDLNCDGRVTIEELASPGAEELERSKTALLVTSHHLT